MCNACNSSPFSQAWNVQRSRWAHCFDTSFSSNSRLLAYNKSRPEVIVSTSACAKTFGERIAQPSFSIITMHCDCVDYIRRPSRTSTALFLVTKKVLIYCCSILIASVYVPGKFRIDTSSIRYPNLTRCTLDQFMRTSLYEVEALEDHRPASLPMPRVQVEDSDAVQHASICPTHAPCASILRAQSLICYARFLMTCFFADAKFVL